MSKSHSGHLYYVLESRLQPGVFKLGITDNLDRRLAEHGGAAKHRLIRVADLGVGNAYRFEKRIKRSFRHRRITDGNELFALEPQHLEEVLAALQAELIRVAGDDKLQKAVATFDQQCAEMLRAIRTSPRVHPLHRELIKASVNDKQVTVRAHLKANTHRCRASEEELAKCLAWLDRQTTRLWAALDHHVEHPELIQQAAKAELQRRQEQREWALHQKQITRDSIHIGLVLFVLLGLGFTFSFGPLGLLLALALSAGGSLLILRAAKASQGGPK